MKYFAEFLVNKGTVSSKDVVEAFIDQILYLPPLPKLVYDNNLLSSDQIIQVFNRQQDEKIDFVSACKKIGVWSEEINSKVDSLYNELRIPLGQFLIQNGVLDVKILVKSLDEYLSQVENPIMTKSEAPTFENELLFKINPLSNSAVQEITEFLNENKKSEIDNLLALVRQNISSKEISQEFLQDILKNIQTLKGLARFSKSEILDYVSNSVVNLLTGYMRSSTFATEKNGISFCDNLSTAFKIIYELRNSIKESGDESLFWTNIQLRSQLDKWITSILKTLNQQQGAA